ncbi:MAG: LysR substrate-binding domain-containing protein [Lawsonibacter sp.]
MLNEMKYVYAVYQEKSFTKAAKKLFISQPALSNMVKKAEHEIGAPIFDRSTLPLTLTKEGKFYIKSIKQIMLMEKNLQTYFDDIQQLNAGTLSVGGSSFFCSFVLPDLIGKFNTKYPHISIDLLEGNIKELREGLDNESLDLIIETSVKEDDLTLEPFLYKVETIILAVPVRYPINERLRPYQISAKDIQRGLFPRESPPHVPLHEFKDTPFVLLKTGNDLSPRSFAICGEAGFTPQIAILTDQILTAANIGATGLGAVFVRSDLLRYVPIQDKFCFYALGSELAQRKIFFAAKKGRYISSAMQTFLQLAGVNHSSLSRRKKRGPD